MCCNCCHVFFVQEQLFFTSFFFVPILLIALHVITRSNMLLSVVSRGESHLPLVPGIGYQSWRELGSPPNRFSTELFHHKQTLDKFADMAKSSNMSAAKRGSCSREPDGLEISWGIAAEIK